VIVVCTNSIIVLENKVQNMYETAVRFIYLSIYDVITTDTYISLPVVGNRFPCVFLALIRDGVSFLTSQTQMALTVFLVLRASPTATQKRGALYLFLAHVLAV
jgi:hypothetical protein